MTYRKFIISVAVAATAVSGGSASFATNNQYSSLPAITKEVSVADRKMTIRIDPSFRVSGGDGYVRLGIQADIDASDLQAKMPGAVNGHKKYDECGTRFSLSGASLSPAGNGKALFGVTAQAQQWECIKTKVPKTYCKRTKIKLPFGGWTWGPPKCSIKWEMKTMKTKLISQSARIEGLVWPTIANGEARANVHITKAAPSGLLGKLVSAFGLKGTITSLARTGVNMALRDKGRVALPKEFDEYEVQVQQIEFVDLGGGRLGLRVQAEGTATQAQLAELIANQMSK